MTNEKEEKEPSRLVVLIASYLNVKERLETLQYALLSLADNIRRPDHVYVSISYKDDLPDIYKLSQILEDIPHSILLHDKRLLQFEHYRILSERVGYADIVCFLDDDDLYHPHKLALVEKYFRTFPTRDITSHPFAYFGYYEPPLTTKGFKDIKLSMTQTNTLREYYTLCLRGWLFKDWFINHSNYTTSQSFKQTLEERKGMTDLIFTCTLPSTRPFTTTPLTFVRKENIPRDYGK